MLIILGIVTLISSSKCEAKMAGYMAQVFFCVFMDWEEFEANKDAKKNKFYSTALLLYSFLTGSMLESLSGLACLSSQSEHRVHSI